MCQVAKIAETAYAQVSPGHLCQVPLRPESAHSPGQLAQAHGPSQQSPAQPWGYSAPTWGWSNPFQGRSNLHLGLLHGTG